MVSLGSVAQALGATVTDYITGSLYGRLVFGIRGTRVASGGGGAT